MPNMGEKILLLLGKIAILFEYQVLPEEAKLIALPLYLLSPGSV